MSVTNFTNVDTALSALTNAAALQGLDPDTSLSAAQLPISVLANMLDGQIGGGLLKTGAAAGITGGTGTIAKTGIVSNGGIIQTTFLIDLTGLASSTTDLDIIGQGASPAYIGRITAAQNGTIIGGEMKCLEAPAGGVADIDLYAATEGTGVFDAAISGLTETAVVTSGASWTLGREVGTSPDAVAADSYLYLVGGAGGTAATYTAGRILITLYGI